MDLHTKIALMTVGEFFFLLCVGVLLFGLVEKIIQKPIIIPDTLITLAVFVWCSIVFLSLLAYGNYSFLQYGEASFSGAVLFASIFFATFFVMLVYILLRLLSSPANWCLDKFVAPKHDFKIAIAIAIATIGFALWASMLTTQWVIAALGVHI